MAATSALLLVSGTTAAFASDVDVVAVVDVTAPTGSVDLAPDASSPITINLAVTGKQDGTATFEVNRTWTLSGGTFTGSNPVEFTVAPRPVANAAATTFSTPGTVAVAAGQAAGTYTLNVGVFDITNSNTGGAKLAAGDSATYSVTVTVPSDTTPPSIGYTLDPASPNGSNGWYTTDVALDWTVSDPDSAVTSSSGCDDQVIDSDQQAAAYTCEATSAGGTASVTTDAIQRDATDPGITWTGDLTAGGSYVFGSVPGVGCTATDATSGPDGCAVTGYGTSVGTHTVTATAHDVAGNEATESFSYTVLAWTLKGFYQPVDMGGTVNTVKSGSTVPLKFEMFAGSRELVDVADVASFKVGSVDCGSLVGVGSDDIEQYSTGGTTLRYDSTGGQFIQNWQTPKGKAGACYQVTMTADDSSRLVANFRLK